MTTTTEHSTDLYVPLSPIVLAKRLVNLRYDALRTFLVVLADLIQVESLADEKRGRTKLATRLYRAASLITEAAEELKVAWKICRPHMEGT